MHGFDLVHGGLVGCAGVSVWGTGRGVGCAGVHVGCTGVRVSCVRVSDTNMLV